ncbi:MAG: restriction endonuclease subunit S [Gammaproteobacteria bacterium]|nr:restriction endonuclease subunit S [Gammaproteobacteria bacterium]
MNAERLFAHYDRLADAPDAVGRLRRFVLDLAVRGKLVEQNPADEPAAELLKRIEAKKQELVEAKVIRKPKLLPDLDASQLSFTLPRGWCWARIDELSPRSLSDGDWIETKHQSEDGNVRLIQLADVGTGAFLDKSARFVTEETEDRLRCTRLNVGDVLIARLPNPIGRACVFPDVGQPAITAVDVAILRTDENSYNRYIEAAINAPSTREQIEAYGKGATRFRVATGHLKTVVLPLPPLAEQRRMVAKVDELMALCDRLEETRAAREDTRDRLTKASLARLTAPDTDEPTFRGHARFAIHALPALTARADQVKDLRPTILSLAVRGKLVEQDPADEPASELLKRIAGVRTQLGVKRGGKPPRANETPFRLPAGWHWSRLDALCTKTGSGSTPRGGKSVYKKAGIPFLRSQNVYDDGLRLADVAFVGADVHARMARTAVAARDLLLNITGGSMGRCCRVPDGFAEANVSQHVAIIRPAVPEMADYLHKLVLSPYFQAFIFHKQTGAGRGGLPKNKMDRIAVAVPPLAEQRRIVAKVDELMALCDRLEEARVAREGTRDRLLDSLLHEALLAADTTAERPTQFNWLPEGRHD